MGRIGREAIKRRSVDKKFYSLLESGTELIGRLNTVASVRGETSPIESILSTRVSFLLFAKLGHLELLSAFPLPLLLPPLPIVKIMPFYLIARNIYTFSLLLSSLRLTSKLSLLRMPQYRVS